MDVATSQEIQAKSADWQELMSSEFEGDPSSGEISTLAALPSSEGLARELGKVGDSLPRTAELTRQEVRPSCLGRPGSFTCRNKITCSVERLLLEWNRQQGPFPNHVAITHKVARACELVVMGAFRTVRGTAFHCRLRVIMHLEKGLLRAEWPSPWAPSRFSRRKRSSMCCSR